MNFALYRIYNRFSILYAYNKYGEGICDAYIKGISEHSANIISACTKIDNILKSSISDVYSDTVNKYCEYLSYFIYEKIKSFATNSNIDELYETLNVAKVIYSISKDKCSIKNFHSNKEYFDNMQELYFRNEILQDIKNKYDSLFTDNEEFCKNYIIESADLYNKIVNTKFCEYDQYYKEIIRNFSNNFEEIKALLKAKRIEIPEIKRELSQIPSCEAVAKVATLAQAGAPDSHGRGQDIYNPGVLSTDMETSGTPDHGNNSIAGVVSGILIGICSLFFTIYKFTPLGSSLHNKIWMTKKKFNLEDKSDELILETSDNESMDLYNSMYNIQYHSSQNA
ncbi:PIR protein [Plasmodium ovale]|nr:PIR protein [Plasmodium ovale]